jgi:flagellar assembly protein FliH
MLSSKKPGGTGVVHFADVTQSASRSPAWVGGIGRVSAPAAEVITRRPPPLESDDALQPAFVRRRPAVEARPVVVDAPAPGVPGEPFADEEPEAGVRVELVERRRTDTMIDDIVPRAEEEAISAIRAAVEAAAVDRARQLLDSERQLVELALIIARRVIAREVSLDPGIVRGLVREGLSALGERDRVVVRVGTFFAEMCEDIQRDLKGIGMGCEVVVDSALGQCGCAVETELGRVDESIEDRLATLLDGLSLGPSRSKGGG